MKKLTKTTNILFSLSDVLFISFFLVFSGCDRERVVLDKVELHHQALTESSIPVRPGIPNKQPFWNQYASRFIYAPAFDFSENKKATDYHFIIISDADSGLFSFHARHPWAPLSPVWQDIPVGYVHLTVEGLDSSGNVIGTVGKRNFYKAAVFNGPYHKPLISYTESARKGLDYLFHTSWFQHWLTDGTPDPYYALYCYPSKMIAAVIDGMIQYSEIFEQNKQDALQIACNAADYLIDKSEPDTGYLAYFPPTYDSTHIRKDIEYDNVDMPWARRMSSKNAGKIMLIYPAEVADAYLDLYEKTRKKKYFNAAQNIADTYARVQNNTGRWPLLIDTRTGEKVTNNYADEKGILSLLTRLKKNYHIDTYDENIRKATASWEEKIRNFDFEGQFEDVEPSKKYRNLANGPALEAAGYYLREAENSSDSLSRTLAIEKAEGFLHFAEDQFIVWSDPIPKPRPDKNEYSKDWIVFPCALEQYECYRPIDAHAAAFISVFWKAWKITQKNIYLAKAISLANSMTLAQEKNTGRYPTWWKKTWYDVPGWLNCAVGDARVMYDFGRNLREIHVHY